VEFQAVSTVETEELNTANDLSIYPNPASSITTFSLSTAQNRHLELSIFNANGQLVIRRDLGMLPPGEHKVELDLSSLNSGVYQCRISDKGRVLDTQKLVKL
jgi:hypothetical protein